MYLLIKAGPSRVVVAGLFQLWTTSDLSGAGGGQRQGRLTVPRRTFLTPARSAGRQLRGRLPASSTPPEHLWHREQARRIRPVREGSGARSGPRASGACGPARTSGPTRAAGRGSGGNCPLDRIGSKRNHPFHGKSPARTQPSGAFSCQFSHLPHRVALRGQHPQEQG
jgi:hypothetical protein